MILKPKTKHNLMISIWINLMKLSMKRKPAFPVIYLLEIIIREILNNLEVIILTKTKTKVFKEVALIVDQKIIGLMNVPKKKLTELALSVEKKATCRGNAQIQIPIIEVKGEITIKEVKVEITIKEVAGQ